MKFNVNNRYSIRKIGKVVTSLTVASSIAIISESVSYAEEIPAEEIGGLENSEAPVTIEQAQNDERQARQNLEESKECYEQSQAKVSEARVAENQAADQVSASQAELNSDLNQLESDAQSKYNSAKKLHEQAQSDLDVLETEKEKAISALNEAQQTQEAESNSLSKLEEDNPKADEVIRAVDKDFEIATERREKAQNKVDTALDEKTAADEEVQAAELEKNKKTEAYNIANEEITKAELQLQESQEEVERIKQELNDINEDSPAYKKAQDDLGKAEANLANAEQVLREAQTKEEATLKKLEEEESKFKEVQEQEKDYLEKEQALKRLIDENKQEAQYQTEIIQDNQTNITRTRAEKEKLEEELSQAGSDKEGLKSVISKMQEQLNNLENQKKAAQEKLEEAEKEVLEAEAAMNGILSEADKEAAQVQWDKGAVGFYETMGSQEALDVFTQKDNAKSTYLKASREAGVDDSRTLDRMKKSIQETKAINAKRQSDGGIDGRSLSVLGISDFDMAVAQANSNYSGTTNPEDPFGKPFKHAKVYSRPFENLSWGRWSVDKALEAWWDKEKRVFDYLRMEKGLKSRIEMDNYISNHRGEIQQRFGNVGSVGHYTNLVDDLAWGRFSLGDNQTIGYAIRPENYYGSVISMVLNPSPVGKVYSIEDYEKRFNDYYTSLDQRRRGIAVPTAEDRRKLEAAQETLRQAESDLNTISQNIRDIQSEFDTKNSELNAIDNELKNIQTNIEEKTSGIQKSENTIALAQKKLDKALLNQSQANENLDALVQAHQDAVSVLSEAQEKLTQAQEAHNEAYQSRLSAQQAVETQTSKVRAKEEAIDALNVSLGNKEGNLVKAGDKVREATDILSQAKEDKIASEVDLQSARENLRNSEEVRDKAIDNLEIARQLLEDAEEDLNQSLENKEVVYEQFKPLIDQREAKLRADENLKIRQDLLDALTEKVNQASKQLTQTQEEVDAAEVYLADVLSIDLDNPASFKDFEDLNRTFEAFKAAKLALTAAKEDLATAESQLEKCTLEYQQAKKDYDKKLALVLALTPQEQDLNKVIENEEEHLADKTENYISEIKDQGYNNEEMISQFRQEVDSDLISKASILSGVQLSSDKVTVAEDKFSSSSNHEGDLNVSTSFNEEASLPETGENSSSLIFGAAALAILTNLGLMATAPKKYKNL